MRDRLRQPLAIAMTVLAGFVFLTVFGSPTTNARPTVPALVPVFGTAFGAGFALLQLAYCAYFRITKGFVVVPVIWAIALPLVFLGTLKGFDEAALVAPARYVTGAACVSALVLGIAVLKGKL